MNYEYICSKCDTVFEQEFAMGEAKEKLACPECKAESTRYFGNYKDNFILKGNGWQSKGTSSTNFGNEQLKKNNKAAKNMRATWKSKTPKLIDTR